MYAYLKGQLMSYSPHEVIVDVHGIGYRICIPASLLGKLPDIGQEVLLYTFFAVRELSHTLYGFLSAQERDAFEVLLGVTGIGPKIALSIIGHMSLQELQRSIDQNAIAMISKVPGIGRKTAERLIVELRDKLKAFLPPDPSDLAVHPHIDPRAQTINDAMSTLINLGYNQAIAQKAIKKTLADMPETIDLAAMITLALKNV